MGVVAIDGHLNDLFSQISRMGAVPTQMPEAIRT
jgi:hypothetical protein